MTAPTVEQIAEVLVRHRTSGVVSLGDMLLSVRCTCGWSKALGDLSETPSYMTNAEGVVHQAEQIAALVPLPAASAVDHLRAPSGDPDPNAEVEWAIVHYASRSIIFCKTEQYARANARLDWVAVYRPVGPWVEVTDEGGEE